MWLQCVVFSINHSSYCDVLCARPMQTYQLDRLRATRPSARADGPPWTEELIMAAVAGLNTEWSDHNGALK